MATSTDIYCTTYGFVALDTSYSGQTFTATQNSISPISFTSDASQTRYFNFNSDGTFVEVGTTLYLTTAGYGNLGVISKQYWTGTSYNGVYCTMTHMSGLQNNAVATVTCKPDNPNDSQAYTFFASSQGVFVKPVGYSDGQGVPVSMGLVCGS
jgi:hypothetical protein